MNGERAEAELELVQRARAGDRAAFGALVEGYQQALVGYLWRLVGDRDTALDLAQDAFVRALRAIPSTAPDLRFRPWLYRIATNLAYDHLRRRRRFVRLPLGALEQHPATAGMAPVEEGELVQVALARLAPPDRAVLVLCGLEDRSYAEAAAVLGTTPEAARKRFARAVERFRSAYTRLTEDGPA